MPNRPGSEERGVSEGDREHQRAVSSESGRGSQSATSRRSNRGFASMDRSKQKEIASKGGKAAHAKGTAHEFDAGEAREAGRKGGQAVSRNREHMAMIGRRGGEARGNSRARAGSQKDASQLADAAPRHEQESTARTGVADREVELNTSAGASNGVTTSTQGVRGGSNSSLGGESRTDAPGAADRSTNH